LSFAAQPLGFRTHDHVFALSRIFTGFEIGLIFDKRRGLTTISDSPTTGDNLLSLLSSLYNFSMDHIENSDNNGFSIFVGQGDHVSRDIV
jgi:hypothetical protein